MTNVGGNLDNLKRLKVEQEQMLLNTKLEQIRYVLRDELKPFRSFPVVDQFLAQFTEIRSRYSFLVSRIRLVLNVRFAVDAAQRRTARAYRPAREQQPRCCGLPQHSAAGRARWRCRSRAMAHSIARPWRRH